jgi:tRNA(Ile)-lysidine synthase
MQLGSGQAGLPTLAFSETMSLAGPFGPEPRIAVAVSGGGDSLALTLLLSEWLSERDGKLVALTVDHGLRPAAAAEARQVGAWLAARGIEHQILAWQGPKPGRGIQAWARQLRYRLLLDRCRSEGYLYLALAHTAEDQVETIWMRYQRQQIGDGLAGMTPRRIRDGVNILRPLLGCERATLRDYLRVQEQNWIDDPSNLDRRYERVRVRQALAPRDRADMTRIGQQAAHEKFSRAAVLRRNIGDLVTLHPAGFLTVRRDGLAALIKGQQIDLLRRALHVVGGDNYAPKREAVARLLRLLNDNGAGTLAHCRVDPAGHDIVIAREARHLSPAIEVSLAGPATWDRFELAHAPDNSAQIAAFDDKALQDKALVERWRDIPKWIWPTLPAFWRGDEIVGLPTFGGSSTSFQARFLPKQPLCADL